MTPAALYAAWRAEQHEDLVLASDHAFTAFLAEVPLETAHHDIEPGTVIEARHYDRIRTAA